MADTRRLRGISEGWKAGRPSARLQSGGKAQCPLSRTAESPLEEARDSRVLHGLPSGPLAAQAGRCHPVLQDSWAQSRPQWWAGPGS